jgi:hypothetical protein
MKRGWEKIKQTKLGLNDLNEKYPEVDVDADNRIIQEIL